MNQEEADQDVADEVSEKVASRNEVMRREKRRPVIFKECVGRLASKSYCFFLHAGGELSQLT